MRCPAPLGDREQSGTRSEPGPSRGVVEMGGRMAKGHTTRFESTRWTLILVARDRDAPGATEALGALCRIYWYPLYAYIRQRGHTPDDAEDLTQCFFARLLEPGF